MIEKRLMVIGYQIIERVKPNVFVHIAIQKMLEDAMKNIADIEQFPRPKNELGFDIKLIIALDDLSKRKYGECPLCEWDGVADKKVWFEDREIWVCERCKDIIEGLRCLTEKRNAIIMSDEKYQRGRIFYHQIQHLHEFQTYQI